MRKARKIRRNFSKRREDSRNLCKSNSELDETMRLIAYEKIHNRNPHSRMFTPFNPKVSIDDAKSGLIHCKEAINGVDTVTARMFNKCFGYVGNDISLVDRAIKEMSLIFKATNSVSMGVGYMVRKRGDKHRIITMEDAVKIINYVYSNQRKWSLE